MRNAIIGLYILAAAAFVLLLDFKPYPGSFALKIVPILSMAFLVLRSASRADARLVAVGLLFSAAGDVFLDLDRVAYFVYGLGSFFVAHVFYTAAFARHSTRKVGARGLPIVLLITFSSTVLYLMFPNLGSLMVPVIAYVSIITLMGIFALLRKGSDWMVPVGALFFVVSDAVIAVGKFGVLDVPLAGVVIMVTYYVAQFLIGLGVLRKS